MTRFAQEINGNLGLFAQEDALNRVATVIKSAKDNAEVTRSGAIRWKSNKAYLEDELCEILSYSGYRFNRDATARARQKQIRKRAELNLGVAKELRSRFGDIPVFDTFTGELIAL